jgi:hypothetical protein
VVAAEGQLPDDVDPEDEGHYIDATGPKGVLATLDFAGRDTDPEVFIGERLKLEQLGIPLSEMQPRVKKTQLQQARCTQCNGPLELRAPDDSRRVACPYCGALLDCSHGKLAFLQMLKKPADEPVIPLGAKGKLDGTDWTCIGFMVRSCTVEGVRYPWAEYLLYNVARGFTWLMHSNGHWVYLTPLAAGDVTVMPGVAAFYDERRHKAFQEVTAVTEAVLGEFYWEVRAGERAKATEYVDPPYSVNVDATKDEVTYTLGQYLEPEVVREAFKLKDPLPPRSGIAPSQPNPNADKSLWKYTGLWAAALLVVYLIVNIVAANEKVLEVSVTVPPDAASGSPSAMSFSEPFDIHMRGNVRAEVSSSLSNDWLGVQGDLVNQETQEVVSFYKELSYYTGVDSDGSWSEGSPSGTEHLSAVDPGRYMLRTTAAFEPRPAGATLQAPRSYRVVLTSDTPRGTWFCCALVLLLVGPIVSFIRSSSFESSRWAESNLGSGSDE